MSHRLCANCNSVVHNNICSQNSCPVCCKEDWADPNEHNDEWSTIYKQQIEIKTLEHQLKEYRKVLELYADRTKWFEGKYNDAMGEISSDMYWRTGIGNECAQEVIDKYPKKK